MFSAGSVRDLTFSKGTKYEKMKNITILGSTGSIGISTLKIVSSNPEKYKVIGLSAGTNKDLLLRQIETFRPAAVAVMEESLATELKSRLPAGNALEVFFGVEGFVLDFSTNLQTFQACYAETLPHGNCCVSYRCNVNDSR